jgi:hypothetical protein
MWKPGKCSEPPRAGIGAAELIRADLRAQPEFIATQAPSGIGPLAAIQAVRSSGVTCVSRSSAARARMSITQSGQARFSTGISSTDWPSALKCSGASIWVPVCSFIVST